MNPKYFLSVSGAILIAVGILGLIGGIIGPTPGDSLFGNIWYFNSVEIWAHLAIGIFAIVCAFLLSEKIQKFVSVTLGILLITLGFYILLGNYELLGAHFEHPADTFFNFIFGVWALMAGVKINGNKSVGNFMNTQ